MEDSTAQPFQTQASADAVHFHHESEQAPSQAYIMSSSRLVKHEPSDSNIPCEVTTDLNTKIDKQKSHPPPTTTLEGSMHPKKTKAQQIELGLPKQRTEPELMRTVPKLSHESEVSRADDGSARTDQSQPFKEKVDLEQIQLSKLGSRGEVKNKQLQKLIPPKQKSESQFRVSSISGGGRTHGGTTQSERVLKQEETLAASSIEGKKALQQSQTLCPDVGLEKFLPSGEDLHRDLEPLILPLKKARLLSCDSHKVGLVLQQLLEIAMIVFRIVN